MKKADNPAETEITAEYTNTTVMSTIKDFSVQAAVPKFMQIKLEPASSSVLLPSAQAVTQKIHVTNSQHGQVINDF